MANEVTGFFSLPRELRDEIYNYVLAFWYPDPVDIMGSLTSVDHYLSGTGYDLEDPPAQFRPLPLDLSILRVCKQMYAEALSVFYGANTFIIFMRSKWEMEYGFMPTGTNRGSRQEMTRVTHFTPWEQLEYTFPLLKLSPSRSSQPPMSRYRPLTGNQPIGVPIQPLALESTVLRHGHLIKRIRIRCEMSYLVFWVLAADGSQANFLAPFAARIHITAPNAFKEIEVTFDNEIKAMNYLGGPEGTYKKVIRSFWPLMVTGKYRLTMLGLLKPPRPDKQDEFLAECQKDSENYRESDFLNLMLEEGSHWAISEGKLIVQPDEALEPQIPF